MDILNHHKYLKYKNKLKGKGKLQPYIFQKLVFLGTNSGQPTPYRNVSSCCLTFINGISWLFDCGEATQHQILKTSDVSAANIEKIFITHLHGDHLYGLPGLISSISNMKNQKNYVDEYQCAQAKTLPQFSDHSQFFEFYGPYGLSEYIRSVFKISHVCLNFKYRVNELIPQNYNPPRIPQIFLNRFEEHPNYIFPNTDLTYNIISNNDFTLQAGILTHSVLTFGFVITEPTVPGSINIDKVKALGITEGPEIGKLKKGENINIDKQEPESGTITQIIITPNQVLESPKIGRKLTILGDTSDNTRIKSLTQNSDFLVHESTLSGSSLEEIKIAQSRGHSTAYMAGKFAGSINAKQLILNHFGSKFEPRSKDPTDMDKLIKEATQGYKEVNQEINPIIITAEDLYVLNMKRN